MSDQDRISPYNINTYQANNWWEKKVSIRELSVDPEPNSLN